MSESESWICEENGVKIVRSTARTGPGCHQGCGVRLHVKDGKLLKVEGDPDFPFSMGRLCPRCIALPEVVYHPDRLTHPLKRIGKRGEDKWEKISWEEAYDIIEEKFKGYKKEFGAESVIFCTGTQRDIGSYLNRLTTSFGSPHNLTFGPLLGHACYFPRLATSFTVMGSFAVADCSQYFPDRFDNPEWKKPECIVVWGASVTEAGSDGFMGHWITECMRRGTELIVVDPRKTWIASRAKEWLKVRPGTDAALALGMLNIIINENLYDEKFVSEWTHGFDALKERVQEFTPARVSEITWIPEEQILSAARMYAKSSPAAVHWGVGFDQTKECVPAIHAALSLWAITGNLDVPGGNVYTSRNFDVNAFYQWQDLSLPEGQREKACGIEAHPMLRMMNHYKGDAVLDQMLSGKPYPMKAAWIEGTNTFVCGSGNAKRTYEAFKQMEFVTVVDLFMTPTAMAFADIVLPAATYPERDGIGVMDGHNYLSTINKAIEPIGECKSDQQILLEMGKRLAPDAWPWDNVQEMFDAMLAHTGMTFESLREKGAQYDDFSYYKYEKGLLRPDGKPGFNTPTGKFELYSENLKSWDLDPLPYFEEPPESPVSTPEVAKEYPYVLTTGGRTIAFFASEQRQVPSLRRLNPDPIVELHPDTAKEQGVNDGDWIFVENSYGRCTLRVRVTAGIDPKVVHAQHGWWFPERQGAEPELYGAWDSNINILLPSGWTGRAGFGYPFKAMMCRIYKNNERSGSTLNDAGGR